ncbi:hypothetical protein BOQ23_02975 [Listeria monocytogenes]|nr:hypothetical protein [Listeria monocytogenes]
MRDKVYWYSFPSLSSEVVHYENSHAMETRIKKYHLVVFNDPKIVGIGGGISAQPITVGRLNLMLKKGN